MPDLIVDLRNVIKEKVDLRYAVLLICGECGYSFYIIYGADESVCPRCEAQVSSPADADDLSLM